MSSNCSEQQALFCEVKYEKDMIENSNGHTENGVEKMFQVTPRRPWYKTYGRTANGATETP
jgi:hypothetical protein